MAVKKAVARPKKKAVTRSKPMSKSSPDPEVPQAEPEPEAPKPPKGTGAGTPKDPFIPDDNLL